MNIALLLDLAADTFGDRVALTDESGDRTFAGLRSLARSVGPPLAAAGAGTLAFADAARPRYPRPCSAPRGPVSPMPR